jgi:hypothetical protein
MDWIVFNRIGIKKRDSKDTWILAFKERTKKLTDIGFWFWFSTGSGLNWFFWILVD